MRDLADKTRRRVTQQGWATCSSLALAVFLIASGLCPSPIAAAPSPSTARIQGLEIHEDDLGTKVEVATDGTPIWTTYRDSDGNLVVEMASSLPADSVASLTQPSGLLEAVEVQVERDSKPPLTRLVIKTRSDAEHSVIADGANLRIALTPVVVATSAQRGDSYSDRDRCRQARQAERRACSGARGGPAGDACGCGTDSRAVGRAVGRCGRQSTPNGGYR